MLLTDQDTKLNKNLENLSILNTLKYRIFFDFFGGGIFAELKQNFVSNKYTECPETTRRRMKK